MTSSVPLWCTRLNHIAMGILASSRAQLPHRTTVVQGEQFTVSWIMKRVMKVILVHIPLDFLRSSSRARPVRRAHESC